MNERILRQLVADLGELLVRHETKRGTDYTGYGDDPIGFIREVLGGKPWPKQHEIANALREQFFPSHRIYDLRHTHATLLLMDGEDLLVVSRRLGHATIKLTADTYAHVTKERSEEAAKRFDRMFGTA